MGKINLTYSWSESRIKCLRECMWKYYLTYFQAWEGWLPSATPEKQRAYMLKNMTNLPMWAGDIVHTTIEEVIQSGRKTSTWMTVDQACDIAIQKLRKGWLQSVNKQWQTSPKCVNLAEHFYQEELTAETLRDHKQKILRSIKAFFDCPLFSTFRSLAPSSWLTLEDFQKFWMNTGEEVSVKLDCGFRQGKVCLVDWKTGRVSESVIDQLIVYAMYALKKSWAKKPEDIIIMPVYLAAYAEHGEQAMPQLTVSMEQIKRQAGVIRSEYPILKQAYDNRDNPSFFNHTANEHSCKRCFFRDMCSGSKQEIADGTTPF